LQAPEAEEKSLLYWEEKPWTGFVKLDDMHSGSIVRRLAEEIEKRLL
jgi:hypothetical protein